MSRPRVAETADLTGKTPAESKRRIEHLVEELNRHGRLYYLEDNPEISDASYDRLYRELEALEAAHPDFLRANSPTRRVGELALRKSG